ncbi:MAG: long-chain fatty acid--CoA ligase, partial [Cyanobacteria bacterium J083]
MIDYSHLQSLPGMWDIVAQKFPEIFAVKDVHVSPAVNLTYPQLWQKIKLFAATLQYLGIKPQTTISLFADNSSRWLIADQGIMAAGAVNTVRSSQADKEELLYILQDSNSKGLVVENLKTWQSLQPEIEQLDLELVILLSDETVPETSLKTLNFAQVLNIGEKQQWQPVPQTRNTLATLIYTSGTTGKPKGAMLSHGNLIHQINAIKNIIQPEPGDRALSILPSWHAYERTCEYFLFSQGATLIYTNLRSLKQDLVKFQPQYMVGVPRLWESLYEGIQKQLRNKPPAQQKLINFFFSISERYIDAKRIVTGLSLENLHPSPKEKLLALVQVVLLAPLHKLGDKIVYRKIRQATGGKIKTLISGGGSLAQHLDKFYEIINVPVLVGYGLTETSPVATARTIAHNLRGSSGRPLPGVEICVVEPQSKKILPPETKGLILIRGENVMQGYYNKPEATAKAIDSAGWFDSGDLGFVTATGDLVITGRAKDTIVLSNGENIEPQPIEDACLRSPYIEQIMLVGQDQRALGALIVPNLDNLKAWAEANQLKLTFPSQTDSISAIKQSDLYSKPV